MKSNRAAMKRFKKTGTGKIRRRRAYASHLLTSKTAKRKRKLRQGAIVSPAESKKIKRMMG
jgi:large subunit ribosomal protein L35